MSCLGLILACEANISMLSFNISCPSLLCMHVANWYTYVCRVRRCKPVVNNHINMSTDNEREKLVYYCNQYNVYFRSREVTTSCLGLVSDVSTFRLGLISAAESNVSVWSWSPKLRASVSSFNVSSPSLLSPRLLPN